MAIMNPADIPADRRHLDREDRDQLLRLELLVAQNRFHEAQDTVEELAEVPVSWYGFDLGTTIVGLLSELLYRMDVDGWVFKRFVIRELKAVDELDARHRRRQLKVSGTAYGEPFDPTRHRRRFSVQAVLLPKLKVKPVDEGLRLYCVLDA